MSDRYPPTTATALPVVRRFYLEDWRPRSVAQRRALGWVGTEAAFVETYRVTRETLRTWARAHFREVNRVAAERMQRERDEDDARLAAELGLDP